MPATGISIALFDDHAPVRDALAKVLSRDPGLSVIAAGDTAGEAMRIVEDMLPDVALLDLNMPGHGITAAAYLARHAPITRIIVLTSEDDAHQIDAVLTAGAWAFVTKGGSTADLRATIRRVHAGRSDFSPSLAARLLSSSPLAAPWGGGDTYDLPFDLLDREEQILRRLSQSLTPSEIGESIGLNEATVEAFIANILMKVHGAGSLNDRS